jgi:hypothetical protein
MFRNLGSLPGLGRQRTGAATPIVIESTGLRALILMILVILGPGERRARADAGPGMNVSLPPQCGAAYQLAQRKAEVGKLVEASRLYAACSDPACGDEVWPACVEENGAVHALLPSIIPFAVDQDGTVTLDVEVRLDGLLVARNLAGVAIPVDPGQHQISFSLASQVFATETIVAAQGERSRPISVICPMTIDQYQLSASAQNQ